MSSFPNIATMRSPTLPTTDVADQGARRVLFVVPTLAGGGAEKFVSTVLSYLDRERFDLRLALFRSEIGYPLPAQVPVAILGATKGFDKLRTIARLSRLIDRDRPQVVVGAFWYPNMILGEALGWCSYKPAAIAWIASNPEKNPYDAGINRLWARRNYRRFDRFVAVSEGVKQAFVRVYPGTRGRVTVLPNPVDFNTLDRAVDEPMARAIMPSAKRVLMTAARLSPVKRLDLLLGAFSEVRRTHDVGLVILGEGPERPRLEAQARALGIGEHVCMPGHVNNPYQWMRRADIFVLASDYEGFPIALVEAQGIGVPAVATNCLHGPKEIIANGSTGLLVPPGDGHALAGAINTLLDQPETLRIMGQAARERTRRLYSMQALRAELEDLLLNPASSFRNAGATPDSRHSSQDPLKS